MFLLIEIKYHYLETVIF